MLYSIVMDKKWKMERKKVMLYELKAILRNRITILCLFIFGILGMYVLLCMYQHEEKYSSQETLQLQHQAWADDSKQEVESVEKDLDYFLNVICDTEEERNVTLNEYEYIKWCENEHQKLADYAGSEEFNKEKFRIEVLRLELIQNMCNMNMCAFEEKGCFPAEVVFADELELYQDILKLEELPFELSGFVDSPFLQYQQKVSNIAGYYTFKWGVEIALKSLEYSEMLSIAKSSPFSLLAWLFVGIELEFVPLIWTSILILFPSLYMAECSKNNSRQLHELIPKKRGKICQSYCRNIFIICGLFFLVGIGIPVFVSGVLDGWNGIQTTMSVDPNNYTTWTPYYHSAKQKAYVFLSTIYMDSIPYEMIDIELWKFLLLAGILGLLKCIFFVLLGFMIGYIGKSYGKILGGIVLTIFILLYSQSITEGMKWNPFSIKPAWNVTCGGTNMTWLNAMVVISIAIIVLLAILMIYNKRWLSKIIKYKGK